MQPFTNPNYYAQYPQYQNPYPVQQPNPYMDRLQNLQQYQQSLQQAAPMPMQGTIGGKVVDSIDVVKATDIPMDGNMYYFPKADASEIYGKSWMPNGTTRILTFKPVLDSQADNLPQDEKKLKFGAFSEATAAFMERFDSLEKQIDSLKSNLTKVSSNPKVKKEAEAE